MYHPFNQHHNHLSHLTKLFLNPYAVSNFCLFFNRISPNLHRLNLIIDLELIFDFIIQLIGYLYPLIVVNESPLHLSLVKLLSFCYQFYDYFLNFRMKKLINHQNLKLQCQYQRIHFGFLAQYILFGLSCFNLMMIFEFTLIVSRILLLCICGRSRVALQDLHKYRATT